MRWLATIGLGSLIILLASASAADSLDVHLVSQTSSTITLGWTPQAGYGYLFSYRCQTDGTGCSVASRTSDPNRSTVQFAKGNDAYEVAVIAKGATGTYPPVQPPPPPPPAVSVKQTIVNGSTLTGVVTWHGVYDGNGDGVEDDPGSIKFYVDGTLALTEFNAPFGDTVGFWASTTVANGSHVFRVDAVNDSNAVVATNTVTATVTNGSPPPPPPPPSGCALPAFPDASCTGVPSGTTLTPSGSLTISTAGTVINARDITGNVVVNAPNVTIRNSRITSNAMWVIENNSTGLVVEDSEIRNQPISGQNRCHVAIGEANFTLARTEITGCENGVHVGAPGNVTLTDNYIHDLDITGPSWVFGTSGPHTDGIQMPFGGVQNLVVRHNTIDPTSGSGATSAIITIGEGAPLSNSRIEDNLIDGKGAAAAFYAPRSQTSGLYVNRNRMTKGDYGLYTFCVKVGITVTEFNDNRDAGTGVLITPDNGVGGGCTN